MKKIALTLMILLLAGASVFAQSDLQVLAVVKYNKNESITVKQLKTRCEVYRKQLNRVLTLEEKKSTLDSLINEKLMLQAAQKEGITIPDSYVDQYFAQAMSQSVGRAITEKELSDYKDKTDKSIAAINTAIDNANNNITDLENSVDVINNNIVGINSKIDVIQNTKVIKSKQDFDIIDDIIPNN